MTQYFEKTVTRIDMTSEDIKAWAKGEEDLGLTNSLFICENGKVIQYCDSEEGEEFHKKVKEMPEDIFNAICDNFFEAIEEKDLIKIHRGLAVFNEMDEYNLGTNDMKKRLMRIRKSTESEVYKFKKDGLTDFIYYKGKLYK